MKRPRRPGVRRRCCWTAVAAAGSIFGTLASCQSDESEWVSPIAFDTATAWFYTSLDSVPLLVEVASSSEQRSFGLSRRPSLDPESGMLFEFDSIQSPDHGFWMWRTLIPLDIAFVDSEDIIVAILGMDVCAAHVQSCPSYAPGVSYRTAIEANFGWYADRGIDVGDRVWIFR